MVFLNICYTYKVERGGFMKRYNLVMVLDKTQSNVLMCYRSKNPYKGFYNLVGGKIDHGEDDLSSAYRELFEETGIMKSDITLKPLMDYRWHPVHMEMFVFVGVLQTEVSLVEEVNRLEWIDMTEDFFDLKRFAGEGNIGHMVEIYRQTKHLL